MVRHQVLVLAFGGSNPSTLAKKRESTRALFSLEVVECEAFLLKNFDIPSLGAHQRHSTML